MPNLRSLRAYALVMEEGSLAAAAARMNLSQSAASRLISQLEETHGIALFQRRNRRLTPTPAAEAFYPDAVRILGEVGEVPRLLAEAAEGTRPALRILCHPRVVPGIVVPAIARLAATRPDIRTSLTVAPRQNLARRILSAGFDIGVGALPVPAESVQVETLCHARVAALLPRSHPLAERTVLHFPALEGLPYIALDRSTVLRRAVDEALRREGMTFRPAHEVSTGSAAYRLVAEGIGFTFVDPIAMEPELADRVSRIPLAADIRIEIGLFRPIEDRHEGAGAMAEVLRATAARVGGI